VTVKKVVSSLADAELEVRYLNGLAATGTVYFVQRTTVALDSGPTQPVSGPSVNAPPIAASAPKPAPDSRSRRALVEKKAHKKKKKGRRK